MEPGSLDGFNRNRSAGTREAGDVVAVAVAAAHCTVTRSAVEQQQANTSNHHLTAAAAAMSATERPDYVP